MAVVSRARHIQAELEALNADVAALRDEVSGTVRLGCIGTSARWLIPLVLEEVTRRHPKVHVIVVDATTTSLIPRLLADELDLAVVNLPINQPEVLAEPLFDEDRILLVPDGHPLADRERVTLADLTGHELLLEPSGTAFRDQLDREAAAVGVELHAKAEVDGLRLIATLAFQGFGAAIVPATAAPRWLEGTWRRVAIDGLDPRSVGLARRQRGLLSAPARALHEAITDVVRTDGEGFEGVHLVET
jgi:LysR family hydrogen peroxide-inducible transcriptional activator